MGTIYAENQQVVCNSGFDYGNYYGKGGGLPLGIADNISAGCGNWYGIERKTMRPMHHRITYSRQEVKNVSLL